MSYSKLFDRCFNAAKKRGKFKNINHVKYLRDIEIEDSELYDELWKCHIKNEFTTKAKNEAIDGIVIRLNLLRNNGVNFYDALKEYTEYQEKRKD